MTRRCHIEMRGTSDSMSRLRTAASQVVTQNLTVRPPFLESAGHLPVRCVNAGQRRGAAPPAIRREQCSTEIPVQLGIDEAGAVYM